MTKNLLVDIEDGLSEVIECGGMITTQQINKLWGLRDRVALQIELEDAICCQISESKRTGSI